MKNDEQSCVIFADLLSSEVRYLCRRPDESLYTCVVAEENGVFCEKNAKDVSITEAREFVAAAFNRAMSTIQ